MKSSLGSGRQLSHAPSFPDIFDSAKLSEEILTYCLRKLQAESGSIFLVDRKSESLQLVKAVGVRTNHHLGMSVKLGEGVSGTVAEKRLPLLVADFSTHKDLVTRQKRPHVESFISFPVRNGSSVLAVINLSGRKSGSAFSEKDVKKLETIVKRYNDVLNQAIAYWQPFRESERLFNWVTESDQGTNSVEKQLVSLRNWNANILQCLSQCVLIFDRHFNIVYSNREETFARLLGRPEVASTPKQSILDLPFEVERGQLKYKLETMLQGGTPFSLNDVRLKDSPKPHVVNMFFSPFSAGNGELVGGLLLVDDNTRNYETRQRLVEAEKFALIGSLTSMITHEVNNPLDAVMRLVSLSIAQLDEDTPAREYLTEAQKGLYRIASLVGSLLSFTRKSMALDAEFTPLNTIIENATRLVQNRNERKDIAIHLNLAPGNPRVRTNDFHQVVSNLLSNAFDAVTSGQGSITVETIISDGNLLVTASDNGCGIPLQQQARIFDAFWTSKEYGKGTGLGLAITKRVVEKYGGTITVQSEMHAGTKMQLTFPLDQLVP
ncbi:MAG: GHKL domain-containing protein [Candidatus Abyssobacteria bacterium SURF_17]|uniref:histidine kinase n=1 Tax=Candidatus Abyssobacteria bacterium SURF_17 TaxID=2093361 RepID=A0A419F917_9BACT|nr:MAG: GHKL domain-containing protein [Candidatus Abyssubacteria bacterium SURF_17]